MKLQTFCICSSLLTSLLLLCPDGGLSFPRHPFLSDYEAALIRAWVAPMEKMEMMQAGRRALEALVKHLPETAYHKRGEDDEDTAQRNEVLSSIAGGLQTFSRQKGGFGFRFGRK